MHDVPLTAMERRVYEATDVRKPGTPRELIAELGLTVDTWRTHRKNIRRKLGIVVTERVVRGPYVIPRWERDPLDNETPREARARVARELAEGKRCLAKMLSGGPCSLLLPCANHG